VRPEEGKKHSFDPGHAVADVLRQLEDDPRCSFQELPFFVSHLMICADHRDRSLTATTTPGCRLPEAPSTTIGVLVFRRRRHLILCQFERDAVTLIGDASEMQRIPINDDFPAADTEKTTEADDSSTHQVGAIDDHVDNPPMSSSAGLRISLPSTPCASAAPMIVTEGGGTASFGAGRGGGIFGCGGLRPACGAPASSAPQELAAANAAKVIARNANRRSARIRSPESLIEGAWVNVRIPDEHGADAPS
jgi:hypothetical protein